MNLETPRIGHLVEPVWRLCSALFSIWYSIRPPRCRNRPGKGRKMSSQSQPTRIWAINRTTWTTTSSLPTPIAPLSIRATNIYRSMRVARAYYLVRPPEAARRNTIWCALMMRPSASIEPNSPLPLRSVSLYIALYHHIINKSIIPCFLTLPAFLLKSWLLEVLESDRATCR